jgi:hypothetical protein
MDSTRESNKLEAVLKYMFAHGFGKENCMAKL